MADALIPPYDVNAIAPQAAMALGGVASYQDVWDLLLEYGLDPNEPSWDAVLDAVILLLRTPPKPYAGRPYPQQ